MQISTSLKPTTIWGPTRMRRVVDVGHDSLDFHAPTKALFNLQVPLTDQGLKTGFKKRRRFLFGGGD